MERDTQQTDQPERPNARSRALPTDPLQRRIAQLRRTYAQGIGGKASALQAQAIQHAAILTAKAEACATDPSVTVNQLVRIEGVARRARADMRALLDETRPPEYRPTLDQMLAEAES
jgi:hypothetical protein